MQSARQKKKFSQQKKRHHDYSKAKGLVKGEASGKDDEEKGKSAEDKTKQATSLPSKAKVSQLIALGKGSSPILYTIMYHFYRIMSTQRE